MVPICQLRYSEHQKCQNHDYINISQNTWAPEAGPLFLMQQRNFENVLLLNNLICLIKSRLKHCLGDQQPVLLYSHVRKL